MSIIRPFNEFTPNIHETCFIAENSVVTGDVHLDEYTSVWYGTVIRGDAGKITVGKRVNIQDMSMVHCTTGQSTVTIGDNVTIGHRAIIHGCNIGDNVLIGMGAIVLDSAIIESNSIVAAGAVVLEGTVVESGSIYAGIPAKKVKTVPIETLKQKLLYSAEGYVMYSQTYKNS